MPTILGVNFGLEFFGGPETLEKQGRKINGKKSPSKSAEKFAGNFPRICRAKIKKITPNPLCSTSGSTSVVTLWEQSRTVPSGCWQSLTEIAKPSPCQPFESIFSSQSPCTLQATKLQSPLEKEMCIEMSSTLLEIKRSGCRVQDQCCMELVFGNFLPCYLQYNSPFCNNPFH